MDYKYTDNGIKVYFGKSYWGANSTFFLTTDNSKLSVRTSGGDKYVYEKCATPSGVTTCSLIRKRESNGTYVSQPLFPIGNSGSYSGGSSYSNGSSSSSRSSNIPRPKCPNCTNGRRVYEQSISVPTFGMKQNIIRCSECGKTYDSYSTSHRHDRCNTCHGSGYLD